MAEFLSDAWVDRLGDAVRAHVPATGGPTLVVEQRVRRPGGSDVCYHVTLGPDGGRLDRGPAAEPDLALVMDDATAAALARGELNAQQALARGLLRVRGHPNRVAPVARLLDGMGDAFASLRAATRFPAAPEAAG